MVRAFTNGGGGSSWNLMLSLNLLKSKIAMLRVGVGGVGGTNFQLLMLSSNLLKSKIPVWWGGGGCWWNQLSTFDAEFKFAKIQNSYVWWGVGGGTGGGTNFQLLMLSPNLLKKKKKKKVFGQKLERFCFGL